MMNAPSPDLTLAQSCTPRATVFDATRHDIALDLSQLDTINTSEFFAENHITGGMKQLWTKAFQRFTGASGQGVFVLSQAMGGGKTHTMISLALLARDAALRAQVLGKDAPEGLGAVRVAAFSGRETDYAYGVWGAIAERINNKEAFGGYYSPPKAPGPEAWKKLLAGVPTLILLDEMPPYFEYAKSVSVGNASLAEVTTAALSNLLVAVGNNHLSNVVVVIADLKGTYGSGSNQLNQSMVNLENEAARTAQTLTPVGLNTDEVYHILRRRLFDSLPNTEAIRLVAKSYADAVDQAAKLGLTDEKPAQIASEITATYPFHPALKDLLARFRDNPGFQQTRGLIRLMRAVVARLWQADHGKRMADSRYLVGAEDINLNDPVILSDAQGVNGALTNAISHDVAANGRSEAEAIDRARQEAGTAGTDAQDAATILLVASLANTTNAVVGLNDREIIGMMARPGRDVSRLPSEVLKELQSRAWYLHLGRDGRFFFKNVENITSKVRRYTQNFLGQPARLELKAYLAELFRASIRDCYQDVLVFPPLDEIRLRSDRISLVLVEPHPSGQLNPEIIDFWRAQQSRNRVAFLTGSRLTMQRLVETAAARKAVAEVLKELDQEKVSDRDPVRQQTEGIREQVEGNLQQAARETFSILYYPYAASGSEKLQNCDFTMTFTGSRYDGESEVRKVLVKRGKFLEQPTGNDFRGRVEERLFTQPLMAWNLLKERAATNTSWWWYHPDALESLKTDCLSKGFWRPVGDQVQKPPFEQESTSISVLELGRNDDGTVDLRLTARHGNALYYEIGGSEATAASTRIEEPGKPFKANAIKYSFLCVDETGAHATGKPTTWTNRPEVKSHIHQRGDDRMVGLKALPHGVIRYTTDGSDPKASGGTYSGDFAVDRQVRLVRAVAEAEGIYSEEHQRSISWEGGKVQIDPAKPAVWKRPQKTANAAETYALVEKLRKYHACLERPHLTVQRAGDEKAYVELTAGARIQVTPDQLEASLKALQALIGDPGSQAPIITGDSPAIRFETGKDLLAWVADCKTELKPGEVE